MLILKLLLCLYQIINEYVKLPFRLFQWTAILSAAIQRYLKTTTPTSRATRNNRGTRKIAPTDLHSLVEAIQSLRKRSWTAQQHKVTQNVRAKTYNNHNYYLLCARWKMQEHFLFYFLSLFCCISFPGVVKINN